MQKGQVIAHEFMLQRSLDEGPTGEVWRALELNVGRLVRLRFLPETFADDDDAMELMRNRFETVKLFDHPHVVAPERLVETSASTPFLVSRFVDGPFLDDYAEQWIRAEGSFPFNLIFDVLRPVASALDEAKARNLVHRSLSPRTIVVSQAEGVRLFDFDLVGIVRERLERNDPVFFTLNAKSSRYLAPEQLLEEPVTPQTDQYSLGTLVAELLLHRPLIDLDSVDQLRPRILTSPPPMLTGQPDHVNAALQRALQKNPAERFSSCVRFLDGLTEPVAATPPSVSLSPEQAAPPILSPVFSSVAVSTEASGIEAPIVVSPPPLFENTPVVAASKTKSESFMSFKNISSAANKSTAETISPKIKKERNVQRMFYVWNIAVLVGCLVAAFVFRDYIFRPSRQGSGDTGSAVGRDASPSGGRTANKSRSARNRSSRKKKEEDFSESNVSAFRNIGGNEAPDEVRFIGTSGRGKKIVFVVDASDVMAHAKGAPWEYILKELVFSFKDLNASQRFQVVYYHENADLLPGGQGPDHWIPVSPENLKNAHRFLKTVKASGHGNPAKALEKARTLRPDQIFFLSDRRSTALTPSEIKALKSPAGSAPIHAVEIGSGMEPNAATPIRSLAQACRGEYKWVNGDLHGLAR